jgi:hypothetical protein
MYAVAAASSAARSLGRGRWGVGSHRRLFPSHFPMRRIAFTGGTPASDASPRSVALGMVRAIDRVRLGTVLATSSFSHCVANAMPVFCTCGK